MLMGLVTYLTTNLDDVRICIVTHTSSRWPNFITALILFISIIAIFALYGNILLSYVRLKRRLSVMKAKNYGRDQEKENNVSTRVQKLIDILKGSKYVIIVISSFTLCWMPWIVTVFHDITHHVTGNLEYSKSWNCKDFEVQDDGEKTIQIFEDQKCIHALMQDYYENCEISGSSYDACDSVHEHLHDYVMICLSRLCICLSMLSSLINPLVHGLWYPGFREALRHFIDR